MTLMVVLISSSSREIIEIIYSAQYTGAAGALSVLSIAMLFYSLLIVSTTIISGSGKPKISLAIIVVSLSISLLANYFLIPRYSLIGAAIGTGVASFVGLILASGCILRKFGSFINLKSLIRILASGLLVYAIGRTLPLAGILLPVELLALSLLYLMIMVISKEISKKDVSKLMKLLGK